MEEGSILKIEDSIKSNSVIISRHLSKQLKLKLNDKLLIYFIQNGKSRPRKLKITGIYNTGMQQFDKAYILMDIKHIQRLNDWSENRISGFEVLLNRYEDLFRMDKILYNKIPNRLNTTTITQQYPEIFSWLELQDLNVIVIVTLLTLVCGINMITALLILILEKTNMIGIMKAVGATNGQIRKIFVYMASYLVLSGLFWGNLLGLGFIFLQDKFHLIGLDKTSYYMDYVPVDLGIMEWGILNLATFILCIIMLLLPALVISNILPSKSIRFN
jgi:lipoprotein-releasing system permease protein